MFFGISLYFYLLNKIILVTSCILDIAIREKVCYTIVTTEEVQSNGKVSLKQKNEEKINAQGMLKSLLIGVIVMAVIAVGAPLIINGLSHWVMW